MCNYSQREAGGKREREREEIGLVTIFHVTSIMDNFEPGQGSLVWRGKGTR